jgi:hypothetical protein
MKMNASVFEKNTTTETDSLKDTVRESPKINSTSTTKVKYGGDIYHIDLNGKYEETLNKNA